MCLGVFVCLVGCSVKSVCLSLWVCVVVPNKAYISRGSFKFGAFSVRLTYLS